MTQKLTIAGLTPGSLDYYARYVDSQGRYWRADTAVWEAYNAANLALYGADAGSGTPYHAGTEDGATGTCAFPVPAFAAGAYTALVYEQLGFEPAEADELAGAGSVEWDGSALVSISTVAAAVWAYATRRLTTPGTDLAAVVDGSTLTMQRGDTLVISLTALGDLSTRTKLWFAVKENADDDDSASQLFVEETDGLTYVARRAAVADDGETAAIAVTDEVAGDITITIAAAASQALTLASRGVWDVQIKTASGVTTLAQGIAKLAKDVTRATA